MEPLRGDVTDPASVERAAAGCELVFNAMGLPEQWFADPGIFDRVNARGTETVVRAAAAAGARRVVHTSTIDVFHAERGSAFDESRVADYPKGTAYERSKQRAEELALAAAAEHRRRARDREPGRRLRARPGRRARRCRRRCSGR